MNRFKILACDLDGILLDTSSKVSERNITAIGEITKRGVHFVPCTGRTYVEIPKVVRENENVRYIILSNGVAVLDRQTGNRLFSRCISADTAKKIFDILARFETHITLHYDGKCAITDGVTVAYAGEYYNMCLPHIDVLDNYAESVPDFDAWKYTAQNIEVVSVFFHSKEEQEECRGLLSQIDGIFLARAAEYNFEIFKADAGKGAALYGLADVLGISREQTAAVGDSGNDMSVVKAAGIGFAVSNATDALKDVADEIVCSNDEHVIDYILKNCLEK